MSTIRFAAFLAASAILILRPVDAGAQGYTRSTQSGAFSSISGVGTALVFANQDDWSVPIPLQFNLPFFGATIASGASIYASTNGTLNVASSDTDYDNT